MDRLLDDDPETTREPPMPAHVAMSKVVEAVRRDIQNLLNTRLTWVDDRVLAHEEATHSLATYGIPDFTHENLGSTDSRERLQRSIATALGRFEPRLERVVVSPERVGEFKRELRFRIDAILRVDPVREPVTFDTVLHADGVAEVKAT